MFRDIPPEDGVRTPETRLVASWGFSPSAPSRRAEAHRDRDLPRAAELVE